MKEIIPIWLTVCVLIIFCVLFGKSISLYEDKTILEIEKLKYQISIYKDSEKGE